MCIDIYIYIKEVETKKEDREEELYIHVSIYDQPDQNLQKHGLVFLHSFSLYRWMFMLVFVYNK